MRNRIFGDQPSRADGESNCFAGGPPQSALFFHHVHNGEFTTVGKPPATSRQLASAPAGSAAFKASRVRLT
jgi:hypothetical protein